MAASSVQPFPRVSGQAAPFATTFLGEGEFAHQRAPKAAAVGNNFVSSGDSRMIAGNINSETSITGNGHHIEIHDYSGHGRLAQQYRDGKDVGSIMRWLGPSDHRQVQDAICEQQMPGHDGWFVRDYLSSWIHESPQFWCIHGGVGCGKTVTLSSVISAVDGDLFWERAKLVYFFFSIRDNSHGDLTAMIRSLCYQLTSTGHSLPERIPTPIVDLYLACHSVLPPREPSLRELKETFIATIKEHYDRIRENPNEWEKSYQGDVYIVIDALDEVPFDLLHSSGKSRRDAVLEFLEELPSLSGENLHVLVSSRNEPDIVNALEGVESQWTSIPVPIDAVNSDIKQYIETEVQRHASLRRQNEDVKARIQRRLVEKADGAFRYAALQMSALKRLRPATAKTIERALDSLPVDLNEAYVRILRDVDEDVAAQAASALRWLVVAQRPLFVEELADACSDSLERLTESRAQFSESLLEPFHFHEMFRDLVAVWPRLPSDAPPSPQRHVITLAHFSVLEFLLGSSITSSVASNYALSKADAHEQVARQCLIYLYRFNTTATRPDSLKMRRFPLSLTQYAWYHWEKHVEPEDENETSNDPTRYKATRLFGHLKEGSGWAESGSTRPLLSWLPPRSEGRLLDALNTPYFYEDFLRYVTPISDEHESPRWFAERVPDPKEREIGVISILPSLDPETEIRCLLHIVSLSNRPVYKAISYALGPAAESPLLVNGSKKSVRPYLASILRQLRSHQEGCQTRYWADVICLEEGRSNNFPSTALFNDDPGSSVYFSQTRYLVMLDYIFRKSQEVIIILGDARPGDAAALATMNRIVALTDEWKRANTPELYGSDLYDAVASIEEAGGWASLMSIFDREWWTRRWTLQEAILPEHATLYVGNRAFGFELLDSFFSAEVIIRAIIQDVHPPFSVAYHSFFDSPDCHAVREIVRTRREYRDGAISVAQLLWRFRYQRATYQTDIIRTIVGLNHTYGSVWYLESDDDPDGDDLFMADLPRSAALASLREMRVNLDMLSFASAFSLSQGPDKAEPTVRTWIPRLDRNACDIVPLVLGAFAEDSRTTFNAGGRCKVALKRVKIPSEDSHEKRYRISVGGEIVHEIEQVANPFLGNYRNAEILSHARETAALVKGWNELGKDSRQVGHLTGKDLEEAIWRTLLADQFFPNDRLPKTLPSADFPFPLPPASDGDIDKLLAVPAMIAALRFLYGRRVFRTKKGAIGLGPCDAKPGDKVILLHGGKVLYVLRRMEERTEWKRRSVPLWEFVGECYVHGVMDEDLPASKLRKPKEYFVLEGERLPVKALPWQDEAVPGEDQIEPS